MILTLGNVKPIETPAGAVVGAPTDVRLLDPVRANTTTIDIPDVDDPGAFAALVKQAWGAHSAAAPGWIEGPGMSPELELALREALDMPGPIRDITMLLTNAGHDFAAKQLSGAASATNVAKYIALTANTGDPGATDTTLTGEIATASGGLVRATGTYAHTTGTNTFTISNTFTANGNDSLPVTIAKLGLFDTAVTGGALVFETLLSTTATLSASGDTLAITWTITA